jgi:hypothetical protein
MTPALFLRKDLIGTSTLAQIGGNICVGVPNRAYCTASISGIVAVELSTWGYFSSVKRSLSSTREDEDASSVSGFSGLVQSLRITRHSKIRREILPIDLLTIKANRTAFYLCKKQSCSLCSY